MSIDSVVQKISELENEQLQHERNLLAELRELISASVMGDGDPDPAVVAQILRELNKTPKWFAQAVENCKVAWEGMQAAQKLPELLEQSSSLNAEIEHHATEIEQREQDLALLWRRQANPDARRAFSFPVRMDIEIQTFQELRELEHRKNNLRDEQYVRLCKSEAIQEEAAALRAAIRAGKAVEDPMIRASGTLINFAWPK